MNARRSRQGSGWDSGRVVSDASLHRAYPGPAPRSRQRLWWRVRVWDEAGAATAWSPPAAWEMGLLAASDWHGEWIGPSWQEPQDLPPETRHLDAYASHIKLTDKIWRGYSLGDDRINDAIELSRMARGVSREQYTTEPSLIVNVTTNSPLRMDQPMTEGLMRTARAGQAISISAFTMAGAMAPVTLSGALAQQNAEILCGALLTQLANPGTPVIYGAFTTNVDMRSGAVAFGSPFHAR